MIKIIQVNMLRGGRAMKNIFFKRSQYITQMRETVSLTKSNFNGVTSGLTAQVQGTLEHKAVASTLGWGSHRMLS